MADDGDNRAIPPKENRWPRPNTYACDGAALLGDWPLLLVVRAACMIILIYSSKNVFVYARPIQVHYRPMGLCFDYSANITFRRCVTTIYMRHAP
jgi:hypothetical protein